AGTGVRLLPCDPGIGRGGRRHQPVAAFGTRHLSTARRAVRRPDPRACRAGAHGAGDAAWPAPPGADPAGAPPAHGRAARRRGQTGAARSLSGVTGVPVATPAAAPIPPALRSSPAPVSRRPAAVLPAAGR